LRLINKKLSPVSWEMRSVIHPSKDARSLAPRPAALLMNSSALVGRERKPGGERTRELERVRPAIDDRSGENDFIGLPLKRDERDANARVAYTYMTVVNRSFRGLP